MGPCVHVHLDLNSPCCHLCHSDNVEIKKKIERWGLGVVAHISNLSFAEVEIGGSVRTRPVRTT
jgi:hypothetical protein